MRGLCSIVLSVEFYHAFVHYLLSSIICVTLPNLKHQSGCFKVIDKILGRDKLIIFLNAVFG